MADSLIRQPLAIVGMACRLPDADHLDAFWNLLVEGRMRSVNCHRID